MWQADFSWNRGRLYRTAAIYLKEHQIQDALILARRLLMDLEDLSAEKFFLSENNIPDQTIIKSYIDAIERLSQGEPLEKITKKSFFNGNHYYITHDVLTPREDTVTLIHAITSYWADKKEDPLRILDIGTGSGCIALSLAQFFSNSTVIGLDISEKAIIVANRNAERFSLSDRCDFFHGDLECIKEKFDIVVSNPPYIPLRAKEYLNKSVSIYDPDIALYGGDDGLEFYRYLSKYIDIFTKPTAILALEFGIGQAHLVKEIFQENGFEAFSFNNDESGIIRCVLLKKK